MGQDAPLFKTCRASLFAAGEPLLKRAQEAGAVRPDATFAEVMQMVMGIAKIPTEDRAQTEHILRIALDGLRYTPPAGRLAEAAVSGSAVRDQDRAPRV